MSASLWQVLGRSMLCLHGLSDWTAWSSGTVRAVQETRQTSKSRFLRATKEQSVLKGIGADTEAAVGAVEGKKATRKSGIAKSSSSPPRKAPRQVRSSLRGRKRSTALEGSSYDVQEAASAFSSLSESSIIAGIEDTSRGDESSVVTTARDQALLERTALRKAGLQQEQQQRSKIELRKRFLESAQDVEQLEIIDVDDETFDDDALAEHMWTLYRKQWEELGGG
ncbi:unnamed protein product, partial [Amoebophrya sp. A120]|eukprot:GSA120T00003864001.1